MKCAGRPRSAAIRRQPEVREVGTPSPLTRARAAVGRLRGSVFLDLGGDHSDTVFLAGSGRSGTTWASQIVGRGEYRLIFEPFDPGHVPLVRGFRSKQYLRPGDDREEYLGPARDVLSGRVRGAWVDRFNRATLARRRLIKDIRANLLLGWMHAHFPKMPMVLVLRHPCAVVRSRLRLGWRDNLDETMEQEDLVEDWLLPFEERIRAAKTPFERHLFLWCIDNYVPLRQFEGGSIHVAFYESLLANPREEIPRLFSFLGRSTDDRVYDRMARPSSLNLGGSGDHIAGWRSHTSSSELKTTIEALSLFGLDRIYGENPMPDPTGLAMGRARG